MNRERFLHRIRAALLSLLIPSLLLSLLPSPVSAAAKNNLPFDDISHSYAKDAIVRLFQLKLIDGTGARRFDPGKPINRAEFITMLDRLFAVEPSESPIPSFTDVGRGAWYFKWVQPAVQVGIAREAAPGRFEPAGAVNRQDAAVMINRAAKQAEESAAPVKAVYRDQGQIASAALPAVLNLRKLGIMQGDGVSFRPAAPITRQEAAVFMDRVLQHHSWASEIRAKTNMKIQLAWQYGQTTEAFEKSVAASDINTLSPRWFFLDKSGVFGQKNFDASLVSWAHQRGKKVWAMAGNGSNAANTHLMLSDPAKRKSAVAYLVNAIKENGIDGINLDFESVGPDDRAAYSQFAAELAQELHAVGAKLSVDLSPDTKSDWTDAYDYRALGLAADYIVLMGYDEHWETSPNAGSVASLPWVQKGLDALLADVPPAKAILAMPFYTRLWTTDSAGKVSAHSWSLQQQNSLPTSVQPVWKDDVAQYFAEYKESQGNQQIWMEEARSLSAKVQMAQQRGIAGYAYWCPGQETPDIWTGLRNAMKFSSYRFI